MKSWYRYFNRRLRRPVIRQAGFNLIELLMAMAMATLIFMAITALYTYEARSLGAQHSVATMDREARFALQHLRRDLMTLGSHTTPNSDVDGWVCPKPAVPIRAIELAMNDGNQVAKDLNPFVRMLSVKLFGTSTSRHAFGSTPSTLRRGVARQRLIARHRGGVARHVLDRSLPAAVGADGKMMFYAIQSSDRTARKVTLASAPPRVSATQLCGYQANGEGMWADVQGFIRYRVITDTRPESPKDIKGRPLRTLLVRERLAVDGKRVSGALPLADNVVELGIYDAIMDTDPNPDRVGPSNLPDFEKSGMINASGEGYLGSGGTPMPERLRALNVVLSLRTENEIDGVLHDPRTHPQSPLATSKLAENTRDACLVYTVAGRVAMPTLVERNL